MSQQPWEEKRFEETEDGYKFSLVGRKVIFIQFGGATVDLTLSGDPQPKIRLGMPFVWKQAEDCQVLDPAKVISLAPLLALVSASIDNVSAAKKGFLFLRFDNGTSIEAPVGEDGHDYEAWEIKDNKGFLAVCAIGGDVFFFLPEDARLIGEWKITESRSG